MKSSYFLKKICVLLLAVFIFSYLTYRVLFTLPFEFGWLNSAMGVMFLIAEFISLSEILITLIQFRSDDEVDDGNVKVQKFEKVDVLIATHNEEPELLYKVVNGLKKQTYPSELVNIFLCDDGKKDHGIKKLAKTMNVGYFRLRNNNQHKAGNLNNALKKTNSPYVITVDADMIANEHAVETLVAHIQSDPNLSFVQSPQSFYNPDSFRFNLYADNDFPDEQSFFFKIVNPARSLTSSCVYCGSNTILRRSAIESIGGIATNSVTEDFATAVSLQRKGWKNKAISKVLFNGLAPYTIPELLKQRSRWCRGCFQVLKNNKFFLTRDFTLKQFLNNVSIIIFWLNFFIRTGYLTLPLLVTAGCIVTTISSEALLLIWLPMFILSLINTKIVSQNTRSMFYSDLVVTIQSFALAEASIKELFNIPLGFEITNKIKPFRLKNFSKYGTPHLIYLVLSISALIICLLSGVKIWILLFWLIMNIFILSMSVLFFMERPDKYDEDVFSVHEPVLINGCEYVTNFISDSGLYFKDQFREKNEIFNVNISGIKYNLLTNHVSKTGLYLKNQDTGNKLVNVNISGIDCLGEVHNLENESYIKLKFQNHHDFNDYLFFIYNRDEFFTKTFKTNILKLMWKNIRIKLLNINYDTKHASLKLGTTSKPLFLMLFIIIFLIS